jgi:hypothetical protein
MKALVFVACAAGLAAAIPAVWADGCTSEDEKQAGLQLNAVESLERAGKLEEAFAGAATVAAECVAKGTQRIAALKERVGGTLGRQAEKKGQLGKAFEWYDRSGLTADADRAKMLQVRAKSQDYNTVSDAYGYFKRRELEANLKELQEIAAKNADRTLADEDRAFAAHSESFQELERTKDWLGFLGEDQQKRVKDRAEQRGDALAKKDGLGMLEKALRYYDVADKPQKVKLVRDKAMRLADGYAKTGETTTAANFYRLAGAEDKATDIEQRTEQSNKQQESKRQDQFKKEQDSLEKELGF